MAIIICPECGGKVSTTLKECPHCNYRFNDTKICPECGEEIDINLSKCPICGFVLENEVSEIKPVPIKEEKLTKHNISHENKPAYQGGIRGIAVLERKLNKEEFFRHALKELCKKEDIPADIFKATYKEIKETTVDAYVVKGIVQGNYTATVGYDSKEKYVVKDMGYVGRNVPYTVDGHPRMGTGERVWHDVEKERTVTDWSPFQGSFGPEELSATLFGKDEPLESILYSYMLTPKEYNLSENDEGLYFDEGDIANAKASLVYKGKISTHVPGDHHKDLNCFYTADLTDIYVVRFPAYEIKIIYKDKEYLLKGIADKSFDIYVDTIEKGEEETVETFNSKKISEMVEVNEPFEKAKKISIISAIVSGIAGAIGLSALTYAMILFYTMGIIGLSLCAVSIVLAIIFHKTIDRNDDKISEKYKKIIQSFNFRKIAALEVALETYKLPSLTDEEKEIIQPGYNEVSKEDLEQSSLPQTSNSGSKVKKSSKEKTKISKNKKPKSKKKIIKIVTFSLVGTLILSAGGFFGIKELIKAIEINNMIEISRNGDEVVLVHFNDKTARKYNITEVTIPCEVTRIGDEAFSYCTLETITFEENSQLTSIGYSAFIRCSSLESITIPNSVTSIGYSAFEGCSSLKSVTFEENSQLTSIEYSAFEGCSSLKSVTFEENSQLTSIEYSAFEECSSLTSITIPNSVTSIGYSAFEGCSSLKSVTFEENSQLTSIGYSAFEGCNNLESITIPFIGEYADGTGATNFGYIFGASDDYYNDQYVPTSLKEVIITGETSIGDYAFYNCSSLTSITIPDGVTSIGDRAFCDCSSLTSITIPDSVTSIGYGAFYNCSSLITVTFEENSQLLSIGQHAFYECDSLTSITIPNSVTSIGELAFFKCDSLTSITIPNSVTSIGIGAFEGCNNLESITIPFIGENAYGTGETNFGYIFGESEYYSQEDYVPSSLKEVIITGETSIDEYAFYNCSSLTSITIPDGVTSIGDRAFCDCSSLTSITIPDSVTSIGYGAFYNCSSLITVTFEENSQLLSIDEFAFEDCSSLTSIVIPNSVTNIGGSAFGDCSSLITVTFEENSQLLSIGRYEFSGCDSLTSITIPNSVTSIDEYAFENCSSLTSITIPDGVTSIGDRAFCDCSSLTSITIPDSVTSIGYGAFENCNSLTIYCETSSQPSGWSSYWNYSNRPVYWAGEWEYDADGNPTPII